MIQTSLFVPPNSPADSHSQSCSRSSSPSHVVAPEGPEQITSSSAIPTDELLSDSGSKRNSKSRQISQNLRFSITSKCDTTPSQTIFHQPLTTSSTTRFHPTLVLQNKGSVARDHLASERTFLAYVRTSLGLASAGVALVQLFTMADLVSKSTGVPLPAVNQKLQKFATPLGLSALAMSLIVLITGELPSIYMIGSRLIVRFFILKKVHLGIS